MPYNAEPRTPRESAQQLRARIPGWGSDLDPADRPSVPKERVVDTGAHWTMPEDQRGAALRERSVEHLRTPPVFGTAQPLAGIAGAVRRHAYARYSEARAAHWLLLLAADRIDVAEHRVSALLAGRPDDPVGETGLAAELRGRRSRGRVDLQHTWMDPLVVAGPALVAVGVLGFAARALLRRR